MKVRCIKEPRKNVKLQVCQQPIYPILFISFILKKFPAYI